MKDTDLAAGIWGLSWDEAFDDGRNVQGTANLHDGHILLDIPFGCLVDEPKDELPDGYGVFSAEHVYGFLRTGEYALLEGAHEISRTVSTPGGSCQTLSAMRMLVSRDRFDATATVERMELSLTGLGEWVGRAPIRHSFDLNGKWHRVDFDFDESNSLPLIENDDLMIVIYYSMRFSPVSTKGFRADGEYVLQATLKNDLGIDDAIAIARQLATFVSFCRGSYAGIERLKLCLVGTDNPIECFGPFPEGDALRAGVNDPFRPKEDELPLLAQAADSWLSFEPLMSNACSQYVSLLYRRWSMPIESRFVMAMQVLDALTKDEAVLESQPKEVFRDYRKHLRKCLRRIGEKDLMKWVANRLGENRKGQTTLMRELFKKYPTFSSWLIEDSEAFIEKQRDMRNLSAHPKGAMKISDQEYWHMQAVVLLSMGIIAAKLGLGEQHVIDRLKDSQYRSFEIENVQKMYSTKNKPAS